MAQPYHTNPDGIPVDPASKRQRLAAIKRNPKIWQVCEGCEALVRWDLGICPICHAYRFDTSADRVKAAATALGKRPADDLPQ